MTQMGGMSGMTLEQIEGRNVVGSDGQKIGKVADVYYDRDTREPEWALVTTGMFGSRSTFVPLTAAQMTGEEVMIPFTKDHVKEAPNLDDDGELSQDEEALLSQHYGMSYTEQQSGSGLPEGGGTPAPAPQAKDTTTGVSDVSGPNTDSAMTRSEEELRVSKTRRPSELVRLRKSIVTEQVNTTVPLQKEQVRIEREPVTDANVGDAMGGPDLSEEVAELTLTEEQVQVDKQVVPKERIRMEKDAVVENVEVNETVRKEQIDVDEGTTTETTRTDEPRR